jgi:hypothetical protein
VVSALAASGFYPAARSLPSDCPVSVRSVNRGGKHTRGRRKTAHDFWKTCRGGDPPATILEKTCRRLGKNGRSFSETGRSPHGVVAVFQKLVADSPNMVVVLAKPVVVFKNPVVVFQKPVAVFQKMRRQVVKKRGFLPFGRVRWSILSRKPGLGRYGAVT